MSNGVEIPIILVLASMRWRFFLATTRVARFVFLGAVLLAHVHSLNFVDPSSIAARTLSALILVMLFAPLLDVRRNIREGNVGFPVQELVDSLESEEEVTEEHMDEGER